MATVNIRRRVIGRITSYVAVALLVLFSAPTYVFAEGETPATDTTAPPAQTTTVPPTEPPTTNTSSEPSSTPPPEPSVTTPPPPTGSGNSETKYTYNPATGLWENGVYSWNPVTNETRPMAGSQYNYNPSTGEWTKKTTPAPDATSTATDPNTTDSASTAIDSNSPTNSDNGSSPALASLLAGNPQSEQLNSLGTGSNTTNLNQTGNSLFDMFYNAAVNNNLTSNAATGDAVVAMNNLAGNAISGSASAMANIINMLQSAWNLTAGAFTTFLGNIMGDSVGDLFLDPGQINNANATLDNNTRINTTQNTAINNTIGLEATSGDATVTKNNQAGNATTGDATAVANLVNAINSSIAAQQSFLGVLNIFGNLNGDILLPQNLIDTLLAANSVGTLDTTQIANSEVIGKFNNNQSITNNINSSAVSGNATVDKNNSAGNAATGNADTGVTVLNMTGRQVVGKDALLVFVNVLGKWVGVIVNAPTGSTSAALGSNITQNNSLEIDANGNQAITNDINVSARSGDATVARNNQAGDATSGDAKTAVNILNINNSNFSLSDWFGVLFINVFGTWTGSFGVDTEAGTITLPTNGSLGSQQTATLPIETIQAYHFTPQSNGTYRLDNANKTEATAALASANVLGKTAPSTHEPTQHEKDNQKIQQSNWLLSLLGVGVAASLLGTERYLNRNKK